MTILVVDDEALLVKGIRFNLKSDGYDVITGSNGQEAVDLAKSENPDLIVLDVMMPVMDGLTATRTIRALPRPDAKQIPIIAMTANVFAADARRCIAAGMNTHLAKPLEMEKVKQTISEQVRK